MCYKAVIYCTNTEQIVRNFLLWFYWWITGRGQGTILLSVVFLLHMCYLQYSSITCVICSIPRSHVLSVVFLVHACYLQYSFLKWVQLQYSSLTGVLGSILFSHLLYVVFLPYMCSLQNSLFTCVICSIPHTHAVGTERMLLPRISCFLPGNRLNA